MGLSVTPNDASDLIRATIQAEDSNLLDCSPNKSDQIVLLSAIDQHQANVILDGSSDSWLNGMESPELSPMPREFPEVRKQLKVLATERLRYFGILSLKSLSRIAAAAVLNLGCSASGLPARDQRDSR